MCDNKRAILTLFYSVLEALSSNEQLFLRHIRFLLKRAFNMELVRVILSTKQALGLLSSDSKLKIHESWS